MEGMEGSNASYAYEKEGQDRLQGVGLSVACKAPLHVCVVTKAS